MLGAVIPSSGSSSGEWCLPVEEQLRLLLPPQGHPLGTTDEGLDLERGAGFMHLFKISQGSSPRVPYSYPDVRWLCIKAVRCQETVEAVAI